MLILLEVDISFFSFLYKKKDQSLLIYVFTTLNSLCTVCYGHIAAFAFLAMRFVQNVFRTTSAFLFRHAKKKFPAAVITLY